MPTPVAWGSEFLVNTTTPFNQRGAAPRALADGRFVVIWHDDSATGGDTSMTAVRGQVFNADGTKSGAEFLINTITSNIQDFPVVTALPDGGFAVVWDDVSQSPGDTSITAIRGQVYDADGTRRGGEFLANTTTTNQQEFPVIGSLADGRFVVAWTDRSGSPDDATGTAVRAQVFNPDGSKSGLEFRVNTTTAGDQLPSTVTGLEDGRFLVAWYDNSATGADTSGYAVRAQLYNANGSKSGGEFLVNSTTAGHQVQPIAASLAGGRFAIVFVDQSSTAPDTSFHAIRLQVFNPNGTKSGSETVVNTITAGAQYDPDIAALPDGRFVVVWVDASFTVGDLSNAVHGQVFEADGTKSGGEFFVNTTTFAAQEEPAVTALADGRFIVTFSDYSLQGGDPQGASIRGQIFDPRTEAVTLSGSAAGDDYVGTFLADTLNGHAGNDKLRGEGGQDVIFGEGGGDTIRGGSGNDQINGGAGNDTLFGDAGGDYLVGGDGGDTINGGLGADEMVGGAGNDSYVVDSSLDTISEVAGQGTDRIVASTLSINLAFFPKVENVTLIGTGNFNAFGNGVANVLFGNAGINTMRGLSGNDVLIAGAGADILAGGLGRDSLTGGLGNDRFVYGPADSPSGPNRDVISDFDDLSNDRIDLSGVAGGTLTYRGTGAFTGTKQVRIIDVAGPDLLVAVNLSGNASPEMEIRLLATTLVQINAADFVL